jgi:hypothetical protein
MRTHRMLIVIAAIVLSAGTALARHRSPAVPSVEVEGVIKTISATQIVVTVDTNHDVTVAITPDTIFRKDDMAIAPTDLKVGDNVEVKAVMKDNVLSAALIRLETQQNERPELVEIIGVIKSVSPTQLVVTDVHNTDVTVKITADTMIRKGDHAATTADLAIGDRVEVKATVSAGVNTAVSINAEGAHLELVEIHGVIKSVSTTQLVVTDATNHDVTVKITADTMIRKDDRSATTTDLAIGDRVEVKASVDASVNTALLIQAEGAEGEQENEDISGSVTAIGSDSITVSTKVIKVDAHTVIRRGDQRIALTDIKVGDSVAVRATRLADQTLLATEIQVRATGGHH